MFPGPNAWTRPPAAMGRFVLTLLAALLAASGCARGPKPPRPPAVPVPPAGYERLVDDPALVDATGLSGRRIVLDPGHGGFFRGALGVNGLTEAEANLGVALQLQGLLTAAGAEVLLTRSTDRDFLSPADSTLRTDLNTRVAMTEAFAPDAFVSIHHNADPAGRHDVNETVTYYKLGDDGPSLELAQDVHRALVRNVAIKPQRIVPGNFAVLRGATSPAILTETSYITYPPTEAQLRQPEKQRLEAQALFVGLARYFARDVPVIEEFAFGGPGSGADTSRAGPARTPALRARIRGAFDEAILTVAGARVQPEREGAALWWTPREPLASGDYDAVLQVRLAGAGTSRMRRLAFRVENAPSRVVADFPDQPLWNGRTPLGVRVRMLGTEGLAIPESVQVRVREAGTRLLVPADTVVMVQGGEAWAYFHRSGRTASRGTARIELHATSWPAPARGAKGARVDSAVVRLPWRPDAAAPIWTGFARSMPADTLLRNAVGTRGADPRVRWINRDGFVRLPADSGGAPSADDTPGAARVPALAGYRPWVSDTLWPPRFVALLGGALHGRRITLDPDGGGDASGGTGPGGTRAADLNLAVARALRAMLVAAGAEVRLTRDGDYAVSDVERVQRSESFRADRFVRIGHRAEPPQIGHYFSSAGGRAWAIRTGEILAALGLPAPPAGENAQYPIQQTSCPSLYAGFARVDSDTTERRLLAPGTLRAEAYALLVSIAREWTDGAAWPLDALEARDERGLPVDAAPVTLGGAFVLETDAHGRARFFRTESGPLELSIDDPRLHARKVLLDSERFPTLTGTPGR